MTRRPLLVVAIGGHALSPPTPEASLADERRAARNTGGELAALAARGWRLLVVHGNGPQVGRLLGPDEDVSNLDIRVAQTQGELGYLLVAAMEAAGAAPALALVTRVRVDPRTDPEADPLKPIGPVLPQRPAGPALPRPDGKGWRRAVPSPRPLAVLEQAQIERLLEHGHLVAGGGGGIAVTAAGEPVSGVIDKDRVAALLAIALGAEALLIGTDVDAVQRQFGTPDAAPIRVLDGSGARAGLAAGDFAPGSMGPKVESALDFAEATGRIAAIGALGQLEAVLDGASGTRILASP
jgi:carbamate kinase